MPAVDFTLNRLGGGATIEARLSIWSGVEEGNPKRVKMLFFENAIKEVETQRLDLPPGAYSCVLYVFIRADLNGKFRYTFFGNGDIQDSGNGTATEPPQMPSVIRGPRQFEIDV